jgi:hypothetical protein
MQVSISTLSGNKRRRRSSSILPEREKQDSDDTVDTGNDMISLAIIDRIG